MLNIISLCLSIISILCCIYCVIRYKDIKADRDQYHKWFLECCGDLKKTIEKWDATIELCKKINGDFEAINRYNQRLIDINADLRLEINKLKENNNA